ncbi:glyoxylate reductase/hydroxypyruvate reductase [Episyrphus balteatus]|uniref:glyoxylate reductase/hydroxypyruvate reductase n=1 Tax=Episyrphus balteatus TaxID=286459 RepID=UPI002485DFF3|nr:glyoxylate reductase/hydroxypyruvate reductase [Episyrphus balteatus]
MTTTGFVRLRYLIQQSSLQKFPLQFYSKSCYSKMSTARPTAYVTRSDYASVGINLLKSECDIAMWNEASPVPRQELLKNIVGKNALFCALTDKVDKEILDAAGPQLKVVATISVGFEHIDVAECKKRGIRVGYTPDVLTDATAELTVALLLATSRRLFEANKQVYNGGWKSWAPSWMCGPGLKDKTLGLFGFGRIGNEIAKRLIPFKPNRLIYTNRSHRAEAKALGFSKVEFDVLLKEADFIVVCCALSPETAGIFDKEAFCKMKSNAIFINTSRGAVVDQAALVEALKEKRILAAGLDVTTPEPLPLDDPLLKLDNVVILPHIGSADINTRIEMSRITACNIISALKGDKMLAEV